MRSFGGNRLTNFTICYFCNLLERETTQYREVKGKMAEKKQAKGLGILNSASSSSALYSRRGKNALQSNTDRKAQKP